MQAFWDEELTEEQTAKLLEDVAEEITKRDLEVPAILFFEMHRPLSFMASSSVVAFSPFIVPFFGFDRVNDYTRLFAKSENVNRLLERLDAAREAKRTEA